MIGKSYRTHPWVSFDDAKNLGASRLQLVDVHAFCCCAHYAKMFCLRNKYGFRNLGLCSIDGPHGPQTEKSWVLIGPGLLPAQGRIEFLRVFHHSGSCWTQFITGFGRATT